MAYFDKFPVAKYIIDKYQKEKGYNISPLKLQKSLYLLFAMWGGNARLVNEDISSNIEGQELVEYRNEFDEYLFDPKFEAWLRGPVDRDVYSLFKTDRLQCENNLSVASDKKDVEGILISFIDSILEQTFEINDFALVDLTHQDEVWKDNFDQDEDYHNKEMPPNEIIDEYYKRYSTAAG